MKPKKKDVIEKLWELFESNKIAKVETIVWKCKGFRGFKKYTK